MRYILGVDNNLRMSDELMHKFWKLPKYVAFSGEVSEESARKFREELETAEDSALASKQPIIPITIDTYGGSVYALLGMIDAIKACSVPIATIVESKAMSCGAVLFSFGAEGHRYVAPNATVMIHSVAGGSADKIHEVKSNTKELDRLNDKVFKEMSRNCGKPDDYFFDILSKEKFMADWYLEPSECIRHNLANHVKVPSINVSVKMDVNIG